MNKSVTPNDPTIDQENIGCDVEKETHHPNSEDKPRGTNTSVAKEQETRLDVYPYNLYQKFSHVIKIVETKLFKLSYYYYMEFKTHI